MGQQKVENCVLCGVANARSWNDTDQGLHFECKRCGHFAIAHPFNQGFDIPGRLRPYVSAAARQRHEAGQILTITADNWRGLAEAQSAVGVSQKLERALRLICERSRTPGSACEINVPDDYPLFSAVNGSELVDYLKHFVKEALLTGPPHPIVSGKYKPTIEAWQRVEPTLTPGGEPDRCFVAMWFDDSLDSVYEQGFVKAIEQCGFRPYRVKQDLTNKAIIDTILAGIRRAHFVVADFTGQRHSVYYEAGFAHGIGREIISCCREDDVKNLTFDTRHLGHIVWKDAADLQIKLANSIQANVLPRR